MVSKLTKRALAASLKKLLAQKPLSKITIADEYSGRFYTPIPEIGNHRSDMKETAIPF